MLKYEDAKAIMNKYYYGINTSSLTLCEFRNRTCLVLRIDDSNFGSIRRILFFDDVKKFEDFVLNFKWYEDNKSIANIFLPDYDDLFPKVYFCVDGRCVLDDRVESYIKEDNYTKKETIDFLVKYFYELKNKNEGLYDKYNYLVDFYNESLDSIVNRIGKKLNITRYDKVNNKKINDEKIKSIIDGTDKRSINYLILDVINVCYGLELSNSYYELLYKYKKLSSDLSLVLFVLDYLEKNGSSKINNKEIKEIESRYIDESLLLDDFIKYHVDLVKSKYSYANKVGLKRIVAFLEESLCNNDYEGIMNKKVKIGKNALFIDLEKQFAGCSKEEKQLATLYNTKYRGFFNYILDGSMIHGYDIKKLYKYIDGIEEVSRMKEECFDQIKERINRSENTSIRDDYFFNISFVTYKDFLQSLVQILISLNTINNKIILNDSINLFYIVKDNDSFDDRLICYLEDDSSNLIGSLKEEKGTLGIFKLKEGLPVVYSPYTIDFGALYDENSIDFKVVNNSSLNLAINVKDVSILKDFICNRVNYYDIIYDNSGSKNIIKDVFLNSSLKYRNYYVCSRKEVS